MPDNWTLLIGSKYPVDGFMPAGLRLSIETVATECGFSIGRFIEPKDVEPRRVRRLTERPHTMTAVVQPHPKSLDFRHVVVRGPDRRRGRRLSWHRSQEVDARFRQSLRRLLTGALDGQDSALRASIEATLNDVAHLLDQLDWLRDRNAELAAAVEALKLEVEQLKWARDALHHELLKREPSPAVSAKLAAAIGAIVIAIIGGLAAGVGQEAAAREYDRRSPKQEPAAVVIEHATTVVSTCGELESQGQE